MLDLDHFQEIRHALMRNKLRTALTAFGVFWGLFMLMIMLGSGRGLNNGAMQGFGDAATNSFFMWTRSTTKPYRGLPVGRRFNLTNDDTPALRAAVPEARVIVPRNQLGGWRGGNNVTRGTKAGAFSVMGDHPEISVTEPVKILEGRFLNRLDVEETRKIAVIGTRVKEVLFEPGEAVIGHSIRINGVHFKVVGIFEPAQGGGDRDDERQKIYVPFSTFQRAFNYGNIVGWYAVTSQDHIPATEVETKVRTILKERHQIHPDDDRALGSWNMEEEFQEVQGLFFGIRVLVWIVGLGTLAAGVIGVSNIMLVIVRERTNEIGIRRAVGATPSSIIAQIVGEAVVLTSLAGYGGLILGMLLMDGIAWLMLKFEAEAPMFLNPGVDIESALQALLILVVSGTLAGIIPAQRAVRIDTVEALRAEA